MSIDAARASAGAARTSRRPRRAVAAAILAAVLPALAAEAGERYPFPAEEAGFPFPVRRVYTEAPYLYELNLGPGLEDERQRMLDEVARMADEPERLAVKVPLILLLDGLAFATAGDWGWLMGQKADYLGGEVGVAALMALLNREPVPGGPDTVVFESHVHTAASHDSASGIEAMLLAAARKGVGALAVTDHNQIANAWRAVAAAEALKERGELPRDFVVVVGEEIATSQGHVVGLFLKTYIPPGMTAAATIEEIHRQGGLAVAAHPGYVEGYLPPHLVARLPFDAVEVGSGALFLPFDFFVVTRGRGTRGRARLFAMDNHYSRATAWLGHTLVRVRERSEAGLREALLAGRTEPVFSGPYRPYRRLMDNPVVAGAYHVGSAYFTIVDGLCGVIASVLRIDGCRIETGYERPLRRALNLVYIPSVVKDIDEEAGVFGAGPDLRVVLTAGPFSLSYRHPPEEDGEPRAELEYVVHF